MPLSRIQTAVLRELAANRNPESFVAGACPLTVDSMRISKDIDVFNDRFTDVQSIAEADRATLERAGYRVAWLRQSATMHAADIADTEETTQLEWVADSDYRFFPAVSDPLFGFKLHLADIATNKALAAAGRREPRDVLDLLQLHRRFLPLGAAVWAAVAKDPGYSPLNLLVEMRRNSRYQQYDFADVRSNEPIDAGQVSREFRAAAIQAEEFVKSMPDGQEGLLYIAGGRVVQPDPDKLPDYTTHAAQRRGCWPGSIDIEDVMIANQLDEPEPRS